MDIQLLDFTTKVNQNGCSYLKCKKIDEKVPVRK